MNNKIMQRNIEYLKDMDRYLEKLKKMDKEEAIQNNFGAFIAEINKFEDAIFRLELLVKYKMHKPYKVGAEPIVFNESDQKELNTQKTLSIKYVL